jgi:membrane protein DedA with SNARE-associated domain
MNAALGTFLSFLLLYKYIALFAFIFCSAVILPLPDNSILLATGAFASQGYFGFWTSLCVALVANVAGDLVGYLLARHWGRAALNRLNIRIPSYINRLDGYVRRYPRRSIFLTRFVGTADSVVNVLSGFTGVPFATFLLWDALGNFVSLFYILYLGYLFGAYWSNVSGILSIAGFILFGVVFLAAALIARADIPIFGTHERK